MSFLVGSLRAPGVFHSSRFRWPPWPSPVAGAREAISNPELLPGTYKLYQPPPVILADVDRVGRHPDAERPEDVLEKVHVRHGPVPARFAPKDQVPRRPGRAAGMEQERQRFLDLAKIRWAVLIRSLHRC